jgi:hypothetical protein
MNLIFTFIVDDHDLLRDPGVQTPGWDYWCLSDTGLGSDVWKPIDISDRQPDLNCPKRKASLLKIEHYRFVPQSYDICITLDGSLTLNVDLNDFLEEHGWTEDTDLLISRQRTRSCIYAEAMAVMMHNLENPDRVIQQIQRYSKEGYPKNAGLYSTRVMVKNQRSERLRRVCEIWAEEYRRGSRRDQLSMNYAIWKAKKEGIDLNMIELDFDQTFYKSGHFRIHEHRRLLPWQS